MLVVNKAVHKSLKTYLEKVQPQNSDYLFASRKGKKAITTFGYKFGWRVEEIADLAWSQVDRRQWGVGWKSEPLKIRAVG